MAYLAAPHVEAGGGAPLPRRSRLSAFGSHVSDYLALFAAAVRVTRAVEARRDPAKADLETLGIPGKLPRAW